MAKLHATLVLVLSVLLAGCGRNADSTSPGRDFPDQESAEVKRDLESLQGTWQILSYKSLLNQEMEKHVKAVRLRYVFAGSQFTNESLDHPDAKGTYLLDPMKRPKRIEISFTGDPEKLRAIYDVEGDFLRMCVVVGPKVSAEYPAEFAALLKPHPTDLLRFQRIKLPQQVDRH